MHRSVLQNRGYIAFAGKNSVDLIAMEEMERAEAEGKYLETYTVKDPYGDEVRCLVRFPGLTVEQLRELSSGPALKYMQGGKIPYTAVVDPHSGDELEGVRGQTSAADLMEIVAKHRKALEARHGKGIDRELWDRVGEGAVQVDLRLADGRIAEAMGLWRRLAESAVRQPEALQRKVNAVEATVMKAAAERLDALAKELAMGRTAARTELKDLARVLRGTDLETRALDLASQKETTPKEDS
jgi:hypothetical protein